VFGTIQQQADAVVGLHVVFITEVVGQLVGPLVEFPVRELAIFADDGRVARRPPHLGLEPP
jgi:hypothetical protein